MAPQLLYVTLTRLDGEEVAVLPQLVSVLAPVPKALLPKNVAAACYIDDVSIALRRFAVIGTVAEVNALLSVPFQPPQP